MVSGGSTLNPTLPEVPLDIKKILPYAGAILAALIAIVFLVQSFSKHEDTPASWESLSTSVAQVGAAADLTAATAITNKDVTVCVTAKSASGIAQGVALSLGSVKEGVCRIPDVTVDVSACLGEVVEQPADLTVVAEVPVPEPADASPAPEVVEAPVAEPASVVEPVLTPEVKAEIVSEAIQTPEGQEKLAEALIAPAAIAATAGVDVPAAVELAIGPVVVLVKGALEQSDASPVVKAWATGVLTWIDSGRPSIIALVENPSTGKLVFTGVDIAGCTP